MSKNRQNKKNNGFNLHLNKIEPLTLNQEITLDSHKNLVLSGFAGTGKTLLATYMAYKSVFVDNLYSNIVFLRSAVATRDIGFLPGNEQEKVQVYELPYEDLTADLFSRGDAYSILKQKGIVNFSSTSFIRGINLRDTFVIVDECQNMSYHELDSIITRLNENCKIVFCGDIRQADLYKNGIADFFKVLGSMPDDFDFIEFSKSDIVRSRLVKEYIIKKDQVLNRL